MNKPELPKDTVLAKLELLRIARELVINEYIDRRAQDHNAWLANSEVAWRTQRVKVPYPSFPPYPSETDIIARANALHEFVNSPSETVSEKNDKGLTWPTISPQLGTLDSVVTVPQVVEESVIPETEQQNVASEELASSSESILPPILKRLEQLKNKWSPNDTITDPSIS